MIPKLWNPLWAAGTNTNSKKKPKEKKKKFSFLPQKNALTSFKAIEFILLWSPISRFHVVYHIPAQTKRRGGSRGKRCWTLHFKHQTEKNPGSIEGRQILIIPVLLMWQADEFRADEVVGIWVLNSVSFIPALTLIATVLPLHMRARPVPSCSHLPNTNWFPVVHAIVLSSNNKVWNFLLKL